MTLTLKNFISILVINFNKECLNDDEIYIEHN